MANVRGESFPLTLLLDETLYTLQKHELETIHIYILHMSILCIVIHMQGTSIVIIISYLCASVAYVSKSMHLLAAFIGTFFSLDLDIQEEFYFGTASG